MKKIVPGTLGIALVLLDFSCDVGTDSEKILPRTQSHGLTSCNCMASRHHSALCPPTLQCCYDAFRRVIHRMPHTGSLWIMLGERQPQLHQLWVWIFKVAKFLQCQPRRHSVLTLQAHTTRELSEWATVEPICTITHHVCNISILSWDVGGLGSFHPRLQ